MISRFTVLVYIALCGVSSAQTGGYSLKVEWDDAWRGIQDRTGRLALQGPLLQHGSRLQYPEYEMDRAVSRFPMADEDRWRRANNGARLWVQSLDEFTLTNVAQMKLRTPMGEQSYFGLRFDRVEARDVSSGLMRVDFGFEPAALKPVFFELRLFPRWEKEDADVELLVGARWARWGELRLRVFGLDPFVNAAYALAESRGETLESHAWQDDWPLALALEAMSERIGQVRFEAYIGRVLPATTRYRFPNEPERDYAHSRSGWLVGGFIEWRANPWPLWLGLTTLHVHGDSRARGSGGPSDERIEEVLAVSRLYALFQLEQRLAVEASLRRRHFASHRALVGESIFKPESSGLITDGAESGWLWTLLTTWHPKPSIGFELGMIRSQRHLTGEGAHRGEGTDHRVTTRFVLKPGPKFWLRFGVGWDLDSDDGLYDGGGVTLIAKL